jgi:hypothetical protein
MTSPHTERIEKTSKVYVVARRVGDDLVFADTLGRWEAHAQYAMPFSTEEEARRVASRRDGFVCERVSEMVTTLTVTECPKP